MKTQIALAPAIFASVPVNAVVPTAQPAWNGTHAYILANTDNDPVYRCAYTLKVHFADGTEGTHSGSTDPTTGGTNLIVVDWDTGKTVSSVEITQWSCVPKP